MQRWLAVVRLLGFALWRAWLIFSSIAVLSFVPTILSTGFHNPLTSDDLYVVGYVFGIVGAGAFGVFSLADWIGCRIGWKAFRGVIYVGGLAIWCLLLWLPNIGGEAEGLATFFSIGSLVTGAIVWPLCRFQIPRVPQFVIAAGGVLYLVGYVFVMLRKALG